MFLYIYRERSFQTTTLRRALKDSNPRHQILETCVLPTELKTLFIIIQIISNFRTFVYINKLTLFLNDCQDPDSNWGHEDLQSTALPTELTRLL